MQSLMYHTSALSAERLLTKSALILLTRVILMLGFSTRLFVAGTLVLQKVKFGFVALMTILTGIRLLGAVIQFMDF